MVSSLRVFISSSFLNRRQGLFAVQRQPHAIRCGNALSKQDRQGGAHASPLRFADGTLSQHIESINNKSSNM
jgi:hypothetical protein